jgi:hypothetical protein
MKPVPTGLHCIMQNTSTTCMTLWISTSFISFVGIGFLILKKFLSMNLISYRNQSSKEEYLHFDTFSHEYRNLGQRLC